MMYLFRLAAKTRRIGFRLIVATIPILSSLLVLTTFPAKAEQLSLVDAILETLAVDDRIKAAKSELDSIRQSKYEASSYKRPKINVLGSASYSDTGELNTDGSLQRDGRRIYGGLEVIQDLYSFGQHSARSSMADAEIAQAEQKLALTTQDVALEAINTYLDALKAQELVGVQAAHNETLKSLLEASTAQAEKDLITKTELARVNSRFKQSQARHRSAEASFRSLLHQLQRLTRKEELLIHDQGIDSYIVLLPPTVEDGLVSAETNSAEIRFHTHGVDLAKSTLNLRKAEQYPTITARASWVKGQVGDFSTGEKEAGINMNFPLYDGGLKRSKKRRAEHELERSRSVLRNSIQEVGQDVQTGWTNYHANQQVYQSWLAALEAERVSLAGVKAEVEEQLVSLIALLEAKDDMIEAERQTVVARFDAHRSGFELVHSLGAVLDAFVSVSFE